MQIYLGSDFMNDYFKRSKVNYDPKYFSIPPHECLNCICYYCYNKLCPHCYGYRVNCNNICVKSYNIRVKDMIPHRCDKCYFLWHTKKPIHDCDFFKNFRIRTRLFTVVRRYRKKNQLQLLTDRIEHLEQLIEKLVEK